jgi:hypothetical protein
MKNPTKGSPGTQYDRNAQNVISLTRVSTSGWGVAIPATQRRNHPFTNLSPIGNRAPVAFRHHSARFPVGKAVS